VRWKRSTKSCPPARAARRSFTAASSAERAEIRDLDQGPFAIVQDHQVDLRVMRQQILRCARGVVATRHDPKLGASRLDRARRRDELACPDLKAHRKTHQVGASDGSQDPVEVSPWRSPAVSRDTAAITWTARR
jgi:hypothetical protein